MRYVYALLIAAVIAFFHMATIQSNGAAILIGIIALILILARDFFLALDAKFAPKPQ